MTNTYQHLQQLDAAHHIHPFNDNAELAKKGTRILTKGEGCYVWDAEGRWSNWRITTPSFNAPLSRQFT
jgi:adenosylmethionine-8-amino-7-oxononanoate aminotransferase